MLHQFEDWVKRTGYFLRLVQDGSVYIKGTVYVRDRDDIAILASGTKEAAVRGEAATAHQEAANRERGSAGRLLFWGSSTVSNERSASALHVHDPIFESLRTATHIT